MQYLSHKILNERPLHRKLKHQATVNGETFKQSDVDLAVLSPGIV
jgi:hypothetical protein